MISVTVTQPGPLFNHVANLKVVNFSDSITVISVKLHYGGTYQTLPRHTDFRDFEDQRSRSKKRRFISRDVPS